MEEKRQRKVLWLNLQLRKFKFLFLWNCFVSYLYQLYKHVMHKLRKKFIGYEIPYDLSGFQCVITGGAGEIGCAVVKKLLRKNCRVLIATIPTPGQTSHFYFSTWPKTFCPNWIRLFDRSKYIRAEWQAQWWLNRRSTTSCRWSSMRACFGILFFGYVCFCSTNCSIKTLY